MARILDYTKINWGEEFSFDAPLQDINGVISGEGPLETGNEIFLCLRCQVDEVERYSDTPDRWRASISFLHPVSIESLSEKSQVQLIRQLTTQLSAPLKQTELYHLFERLLTADSVTHVANRARFDAALEQEWRRGQRDRNPLSLVLFRIQGLSLNESDERDPAIDDCLRQIAAVLKAGARRSADLVARYQDDTLALLLPNTPPQAASQVAENMQKNVLNLLTQLETAPGQAPKLHLGVAGLTPAQGAMASDLTTAAEQSLKSA